MMPLLPYIVVHLIGLVVLSIIFIIVRRIRGDDLKVRQLEKRIDHIRLSKAASKQLADNR